MKNNVTVSRRGTKWITVAEQLYKIQQKIKELARVESQLKDNLKQLSYDKPAQGGGYKFIYICRSGDIDYKAIPELKKVDLELYRKPLVQMWKLRAI